MDVNVNLLAVGGAAVASMILGFAWYSPVLFGKPWMKLMGYTEKSLKEAQAKMGPMYALSFLGALVMAYVLSHVSTLSAAFFQYPLQTAAISSGFWMWLGFVAPVQMTDVIFGDKKWKLYAINTGYQLVSLLLMGAIIGYLA